MPTPTHYSIHLSSEDSTIELPVNCKMTIPRYSLFDGSFLVCLQTVVTLLEEPEPSPAKMARVMTELFERWQIQPDIDETTEHAGPIQ